LESRRAQDELHAGGKPGSLNQEDQRLAHRQSRDCAYLRAPMQSPNSACRLACLDSGEDRAFERVGAYDRIGLAAGTWADPRYGDQAMMSDDDPRTSASRALHKPRLADFSGCDRARVPMQTSVIGDLARAAGRELDAGHAHGRSGTRCSHYARAVMIDLHGRWS
jgi:hypothetical protein